MLQSLHVKNLALIKEAEIEFGEGLNILTGETGAGKSVLIGSVNLALGGKFDKDMIRQGADSCLVELVFQTLDPKVCRKLETLELPVEEDGSIIISRKMSLGRSVSKINGETVTARQIKELAELLIDIHGQHEHQSLLHKKKHMEILDDYCGEDFAGLAEAVGALYRECSRLRRTIEEETLDEEAKARELSLLEFETQEIEDARLSVGEDDELEITYRKMVNARKITENLGESYEMTGSDGAQGAATSVSRAIRLLSGIAAYDPALEGFREQLGEIENLLYDYNHEVASYLSDLEYEEADFKAVEDRLNTINHLKGKYGKTIEDIVAYQDKCKRRLEQLADYEAYMDELQRKLKEQNAALLQACKSLSDLRKENAAELKIKLEEALVNLNFLNVEFEIDVRPEQTITALGYDEVEFMISTNPGEPLKPLAQVASGGELSRVMLAIKTVLAGRDSIDTLIFDEIDAGISGRTAWRVSAQLNVAAGDHQVICITHLPQIAAMADVHFIIEKSSDQAVTLTDIRLAQEEESLKELARLLGGDTLTQAALTNAKEMKELAAEQKVRR